MADIDPTKPTEGMATTLSVRNNFQACIDQDTNLQNQLDIINQAIQILATSLAMTIDNAGKVGIGSASPLTTVDVIGAADSLYGTMSLRDSTPYAADVGGGVAFLGQYTSGGSYSVFSRIKGGKTNATDGEYSGYLAFYTRPTSSLPAERMRIDSAGNLLIGKTSALSTTVGHWFAPNGGAYHVRDSNRIFYINRLSTDGDLVEFAQDNTVEGTISVSGNTVSYNGGHLSRWSQSDDGSTPAIPRGTVMSSTGVKTDFIKIVDKETNEVKYITRADLTPAQQAKLDARTEDRREGVKGNVLGETAQKLIVLEDNEQLTNSKVSDIVADVTVSGVFERYDEDGDMVLAENGDFVIRATGPITNGDLLESNGDGTAKAQADGIVRSSTIGKALVTVIQEATDESTIPCLLMLA